MSGHISKPIERLNDFVQQMSTEPRQTGACANWPLKTGAASNVVEESNFVGVASSKVIQGKFQKKLKGNKFNNFAGHKNHVTLAQPEPKSRGFVLSLFQYVLRGETT